MKEMLVTANHGAAIAVAMAGRANRSARGFGGGIYPITPQSECIEVLCAQEIERSHLVHVESEHSAMGVCIGFSSAGARSFTATSSNGLVYMAENAVAASYSRLPIVMMVVNRTIGPPWNIWADHGDSLMLRDAGWIQFYCEDNQEVADTLLLAFRLAEDHRVLVRVMVCQDVFGLSHTVMKIEMPEQDEVDRSAVSEPRNCRYSGADGDSGMLCVCRARPLPFLWLWCSGRRIDLCRHRRRRNRLNDTKICSISVTTMKSTATRVDNDRPSRPVRRNPVTGTSGRHHAEDAIGALDLSRPCILIRPDIDAIALRPRIPFVVGGWCQALGPRIDAGG